jgi:tetratricopeptide (TPR) repeat protein
LFLALRKKIYQDKEHPSIASTFYSIAQQYSNLGQYEKALQAFQDVLGKGRELI